MSYLGTTDENYTMENRSESRHGLVSELEAQKNLMVAVATGGPEIRNVNAEYIRRRVRIREGLSRIGIPDTNPYSDLWAWYGKWSSEDLPTYRSRRQYLSELLDPLIEAVARGTELGTRVFQEPSGWAKVDRQLDGALGQLAQAKSEEDFQVVGLRCREVLISLGQEVFDPDRHAPSDGVTPSDTDAKRMLEAYLLDELHGSTNKEARKHARATVDFAVSVQHKRTAAFRDAALCAEATASVVNLIAILSGRRDP